MKILILGGEGFLGTQFKKLGTKLGHTVISYDITGNPDKLIDIKNIKQKDLISFDLIVFCSEITDRYKSFQNPEEVFNVNVNSVIKILEIIKNIKINFIYLNDKEKHNTPYDISKLSASKLCEVYGKMYNLNIELYNTPTVFGEKGKGIVNNIIESILKRQPIKIYGKSSDLYDFVYSDDIVENILQYRRVGENNLSSGELYTIDDIARKVSEITKLPYTFKELEDSFKHSRITIPVIKNNTIIKKTPIDRALYKTILGYDYGHSLPLHPFTMGT